MQRICFVTGGELPVPAINGGAIEQLLELLINENELHPQYYFTIIECSDEKVKRLSMVYRYTKFVFIKHPHRWMQKYFWWKLRGAIRKFTSIDGVSLLPYNKRVINYLCKEGNKFDYIIDEGAEIGIFLKPSKMLGQDKFILHIHCDTLSTPLIEHIFNNVIAVGKFVQEQFMSTIQRKNLSVWVLKNKIDIDRFSKNISNTEKIAIRHHLGFSPDDFVIIYCGRLIEVKGVKELIEAVLSIDNPKIKLMIVGSSNFKNASVTEYQRSIYKIVNNYKERIKFTGYINNVDLYRYHKSANLAVVPSLCNEAFNLALAEFLASGIPTIATDSGEMRWVGTEETTLFIKRGKNIRNDIKNAILKLYDNPFKLKIMSRKSVERSFLFDKHTYLLDFAKIINSIDQNHC